MKQLKARDVTGLDEVIQLKPELASSSGVYYINIFDDKQKSGKSEKREHQLCPSTGKKGAVSRDCWGSTATPLFSFRRVLRTFRHFSIFSYDPFGYKLS